MPNIRYVGAEAATEAFGKTFLASEWTDESGLDPEHVAILAQNPQFVVTDAKPDKPAPVVAAPVPPVAPAPAPAA